MNHDDVRGKLRKRTETLRGLSPGLEEVRMSRNQRMNHLPDMGDWGEEGLAQRKGWGRSTKLRESRGDKGVEGYQGHRET